MSNKTVETSAKDFIEIRVIGPSGCGKTEVMDYIRDSLQGAGNVIGVDGYGVEKSISGDIPYDSINAMRSPDVNRGWGLKELSHVDIPAYLMSRELVDVLAKQGLMARIERDPMLDEFIEVMKKNAEVGEGWGLSLEVEGGSFKSADTRLAFAGFKFGRAMQ